MIITKKGVAPHYSISVQIDNE